MQKISGTFNGTGAAVYLCLGFVPDVVRIVAVGDAEVATVHWSRHCRVAAIADGWLEHGGDQAVALYTAGNGVEPYVGEDLLDSSNQTSTTYGEGVYLGFDHQNYARNSSYGYVDAPIDTWTLDTSANRTGHFNDDVPSSGARLGAGSRIIIEEDVTGKERDVFIEAVTAGQGEAADEVTLSQAIPSGKVRYIGGRYDLAPIALGKVTPAGIKLNATTDINVNDQIQWIEAIKYDN